MVVTRICRNRDALGKSARPDDSREKACLIVAAVVTVAGV
jgi:hypothetical protein